MTEASKVLVARLEQIIALSKRGDSHAMGQIHDLAARALGARDWADDDAARPVSAEVAEALRSIAEGIFEEGAVACRATPFDAVRVLALGIAAGAVMRAREGA